MIHVSLQLTLARAEAAAAEDKWRLHKQGCPACVRAARQRSGKHAPCLIGTRLMKARADAQKALREAQELERQPIPGQLTLDDVCDA